MNIQSLESIQPKKPGALAGTGNAKLRAACSDFEALLVGFMMKSMRNTVGESGLVEKNLGEDIFTDMLDGEYSKLMAKRNTMGLGDMLYRQLAKNEPAQAASAENSGPLAPLPARSPIQVHDFQRETISDLDLSAVKRVAKFNSLINAAARTHGVDPNLVRGMIVQESSGIPDAVSKAGAKGLMQLMDGTARDLNVQDVFSPAENIEAGVRYLRTLLNRFGQNVQEALASYNAGPSNVEQYGGIPPFPETEKYVASVLSYARMFRNYYGG